MFVSLFLITAIATTELPTTDITATSLVQTTQEEKDLQELIAIFTSSADEDKKDKTVIAQKTATPEEPVAEQNTTITITNSIEPSMLAYKHWTGTYSPETFTVTINGTEIDQGKQHTLPTETKKVDIAFNYSFMNGMRKGTKTVSYELHENITQADITFSWKDDWQILVDNGTAVKKVSA